MNSRVPIEPTFDLSDILGGVNIVAFGVGADSITYIVAATGCIDDDKILPKSVHSSKVALPPLHDYRIVGLDGNRILLDTTITSEPLHIHYVQPLPERKLLVASGRTRYRGPDDFVKNGRIYSHQGQLLFELLLGDGIEDIQTSEDGTIWTSFFDEGIFGQYPDCKPIGAPGLIAWDASGTKRYAFQPDRGLDYMSDCYALNVASDSDVWCYYYHTFPLVRIRDRRIDTFWQVPIGGCHAFAISDEYALFAGGRKRNGECYVLDLSPRGEAKLVTRSEFVDHQGKSLTFDRIVGRGDSLCMLQGTKIYWASLAAVMESLGL